MAPRFYTKLFTRLEEEAHPVVQRVIKFVEKQTDEWEKFKNLSEFDSINSVVSFFIDATNQTPDFHLKRKREVFQYFCASVTYAEIIKYSYLNRGVLQGDLYFPDGVQSKVTLKNLNEIAMKIVDKLRESVFLHYGSDTVEPTQDIVNILKNYYGSLASRQSRGNIPFLTVYKDKFTEVSIRRGIELYLSTPNNNSNEVKSGDEYLNNFPVRVYHNEFHSESSVDVSEKLSNVIKNNAVRGKLFRGKGKHITWIHKSAVEYNRFRTLYQIDIIEGKRIRKEKPDEKYKRALKELVGSGTTIDPSDGTLTFKQEDLLVSFFSNELFRWENTTVTRQELEDYSDDLIKTFVVDRNSKMFLGFCFRTIQDCGHANSSYATGSKNVLLLALTRGLNKLLFQITDKEAVYCPDKEFDLGRIDQPNNTLLPIFICRRVQSPKMVSEVNGNGHPLIGRTKVEKKTMVRSRNHYLGGNDSGITVKVRIKKKLLAATILLIIVLIVFAVMYSVAERGKLKWPSDYFRLAGSILELWASIAGLFFVLVKACYRKWEFGDMIHSRRRCRSLSELIGTLKSRPLAIELCSTIPKPEKVFSYHRSCAFTSDGNGEFEIDGDIEVFDLQEANFVFGVTYYGEPVVADARGNIRRFYLQSKEIENTLHIAGNHEHQPDFIFQLPTINKFVGARKLRDEEIIA